MNIFAKMNWRLLDGGLYHIKTSPLICRANQWTGLYMIGAFVIRVLNVFSKNSIIDVWQSLLRSIIFVNLLKSIWNKVFANVKTDYITLIFLKTVLRNFIWSIFEYFVTYINLLGKVHEIKQIYFNLKWLCWLSMTCACTIWLIAYILLIFLVLIMSSLSFFLANRSCQYDDSRNERPFYATTGSSKNETRCKTKKVSSWIGWDGKNVY